MRSIFWFLFCFVFIFFGDNYTGVSQGPMYLGWIYKIDWNNEKTEARGEDTLCTQCCWSVHYEFGRLDHRSHKNSPFEHLGWK